MKTILSLLALWGRTASVVVLLAFLVATVQQCGGADMARAGGFWSTP